MAGCFEVNHDFDFKCHLNRNSQPPPQDQRVQSKEEEMVEIGNGWISPPRARTPPRVNQPAPEMPENKFATPYKQPFNMFDDEETADTTRRIINAMQTPPRATVSRYAALRKKL